MTRRSLPAPAYVVLLLWSAGCVTTGEVGPMQECVAMQHLHERLSVSCFNDCWTLIDKGNRSAEDEEDMLLLAYSSLWHWKRRTDCKPENLSVGYWQVSRVHAVAGQYEMARLFGEKCLEVGQNHALPPFCVGYAYEALARAELLGKDDAKARAYLSAARHELERVTDKEEKDLLQSDIAQLEKQTQEGTDAGEGK